MEPFLGFHLETMWHDPHVVEILFRAWNGAFGGIAEIYVGLDDLTKMAEILRGFPANDSDIREVMLGTFDPKFADGGVSLRFFLTDRRGYAGEPCSVKAGALIL